MPGDKTILMGFGITEVIHMILVNVVNMDILENMPGAKKGNSHRSTLPKRKREIVQHAGNINIPDGVIVLTDFHPVAQSANKFEPVQCDV